MATRITRREALKLGALGGGALLLPWGLRSSMGGQLQPAHPMSALSGPLRASSVNASPAVTPFTVEFVPLPVLAPVCSDATTDYYQIKIQESDVEILPGKKTRAFSYAGRVPGFTIRANASDTKRSKVRFINELPGATAMSIHNHGMASQPQYDGYAEDLLQPGTYKDYIYPNNRPATLWYHDHAIHHTAENVYRGLAAFYIVQDNVELGLSLPKGDYDVPLIIKDALFANDGTAIFDDQGQSTLMGDVITVNGKPWPRMRVEPRKYRFRILNGSTGRSYRLALSTRDLFTVIGTDGGLMPEPKRTRNFRISQAERYEVVIDFSPHAGKQVILQNLSNPNNEPFPHTDKVMLFDVTLPNSSEPDPVLPATLRNHPVMGLQPSPNMRKREFVFERKNGLWTINGKIWDKNRVDANPGVNDVEIWRFTNKSGGWFHPIHVHLIDFKILSRNGRAPFPYEIGPKDTAYVGENEVVDVIVQFKPSPFEARGGKYVIHCHNTVHEDHDMMTQFEVGTGAPDPISAARPKPSSQMGGDPLCP